MAKEQQIHGKVLEGDYSGCNVYRWDETKFVIVDGKIARGIFAAPYTIVQDISKETVQKYEEISITNQNADTENILKGGFYFGVIGAIAAANVKSNNFDIAFYFKNGKKSLVRIYFDTCYRDIKKMLFEFNS